MTDIYFFFILGATNPPCGFHCKAWRVLVRRFYITDLRLIERSKHQRIGTTSMMPIVNNNKNTDKIIDSDRHVSIYSIAHLLTCRRKKKVTTAREFKPLLKTSKYFDCAWSLEIPSMYVDATESVITCNSSLDTNWNRNKKQYWTSSREKLPGQHIQCKVYKTRASPVLKYVAFFPTY